jgi:methylase of polypeptide subunit release factors
MNKNLTFKNGIHIEWNHGDDGGGSTHYTDFLDALRNKKYKNGLEWCAGLSAIAFSLIDASICEKFTLMDVYEPALKKAKENAETNNIGDKIKYYVCDKISELPNNEKFDLVVGNPPHSIDEDWIPNNNEGSLIRRLTVDLNYSIHEEFFKNITSYLNPNADLYISEICRHSVIDKYVKNAGLVLVEEIPSEQLSKDSKTDAFIAHYRYETEVH